MRVDNISKYNASLTPSERTENARKSGVASGRARRNKAHLLKQLKSPIFRDKLQTALKNEAVLDAIIDGLIEDAKHNDRAFTILRDTLEGKPTAETIEQINTITITLED